MKRTNRTVIAVSLILICCGVLYGQDQLVTFTSQLQKTPTDNVLREKIIKLAAAMKPAPAVPDEAIRFEGRAQYAFKSAKSKADYLVAAQEYEKAVANAPWVSGYYSDLCTIYDKAGKPEDAKRNCGFYLVALTDPDQITDAKRRIAGLEFAIEKANSPEGIAEREKELADARAAKAKATLSGNWKVFVDGRPQKGGDPIPGGGSYNADFHYRFEPRGNEITVYYVTDSDPTFPSSWCRRNGGGWSCRGDEDLFVKLTVDGGSINGNYTLPSKASRSLSGTITDSEIRWIYKDSDQKGNLLTSTSETVRRTP